VARRDKSIITDVNAQVGNGMTEYEDVMGHTLSRAIKIIKEEICQTCA
jgi:hypothetical protein